MDNAHYDNGRFRLGRDQAGHSLYVLRFPPWIGLDFLAISVAICWIVTPFNSETLLGIVKKVMA